MWEHYLFLLISGELYEIYYYRADFSFELLIIKVFERKTIAREPSPTRWRDGK
jgi:hypothetical protein